MTLRDVSRTSADRACLACGAPLSGRVDRRFCGDRCRKRHGRRGGSGLILLSIEQRRGLAGHLARFPGSYHARPETMTVERYRELRAGRASVLAPAEVGALMLAYPGCVSVLFGVDPFLAPS